MAPRNTAFNPKWKKSYSWINSVDGDEFKAYCKLCKKVFSIAHKGEASIKEHAEGAKHKQFEKSTSSAQSLHHFFARTYKFNLTVSISPFFACSFMLFS